MRTGAFPRDGPRGPLRSTAGCVIPGRMTLRAICLTPDELGEMIPLLAAAKLPTEDVCEQGRTFFRFEDDTGPIGYAGWEGRGPDRLLRSLVVTPDRQGEGLGEIALGLIEEHARTGGAERLHLLTTSAVRFFERHGYEATDRGHAPESVRTSSQFTSLCPGSATYMVKTLLR